MLKALQISCNLVLWTMTLIMKLLFCHFLSLINVSGSTVSAFLFCLFYLFSVYNGRV